MYLHSCCYFPVSKSTFALFWNEKTKEREEADSTDNAQQFTVSLCCGEDQIHRRASLRPSLQKKKKTASDSKRHFWFPLFLFDSLTATGFVRKKKTVLFGFFCLVPPDSVTSGHEMQMFSVRETNVSCHSCNGNDQPCHIYPFPI